MQYRVLGRTGLTVSEIGLGGAPFGITNYNEVWDPWSEAAERSSLETIHAALDHGINYIDTAPGYGEGRSEELIGKVLGARRDAGFVATKTEWQGRTKAQVIERCEGSLRRLQTDYLDVLQLHGGDYRPDDVDYILHGGPLDGLQALQQAGKVRFIGLTAEEPVTLRPFLATGLFDVVQIKYNLIYQAAWHNAIPEAQAAGCGIVLMRSLTSGIFQKLMRWADPEIDRRIDLHALALQYVLSDARISCALLGMRRAAEVLRNGAIADDTSRRIDLEWLHQRQV